MAEYNRPTTEVEFHENFAEKKPLMNDSEAYFESARCLFCYDAPCITACPTGIDIPLFIKQIQSKNLTGSAKTIFEANWLGNACGKICPTGVLCEGACVHNHQDVPPIQIGRLQNYATQTVIDAEKRLFEPGLPNGKKVAMIGAGPASIACACELRVLGYEVDIFEAKEKPTGLTVYGIAPYKITNQEVLSEFDYLQSQLKFNIHYQSSIDTKQDLLDIEQAYDAVFLGVGLGPTGKLNLKGEDLPGVTGGVEFVEELRMKHHKLNIADRVVVIGGGNTAMDAASESARMGAQSVTLAYRRGKKRMSAYDFEYKLAISSGVQSIFHAQPVEILGDEKVTGVKFIKSVNEQGRLKFIEESEFIIPCEQVIMATGQGKQAHFLSKINNLVLDNRNCIVVDSETYQTSNPMYFAGGDAVNGGAEVVNAAYEGKMAAKGIDQWLNESSESEIAE